MTSDYDPRKKPDRREKSSAQDALDTGQKATEAAKRTQDKEKPGNQQQEELQKDAEQWHNEG